MSVGPALDYLKPMWCGYSGESYCNDFIGPAAVQCLFSVDSIVGDAIVGDAVAGIAIALSTTLCNTMFCNAMLCIPSSVSRWLVTVWPTNNECALSHR